MSALIIIDASKPAEKTALSILAAAEKLGMPVDALLVGTQAEPLAQAIKSRGFAAIYTLSQPQPVLQADMVKAALDSLDNDYTHYLMPANSSGKDVLPYLAALMDVQAVTDVTAIHAANRFSRPIYAGNVLVSVTSNQPVQCLTIRTTAFAAADSPPAEPCEVRMLTAPSNASPLEYAPVADEAETVVDLSTARMVVSAGQGIGGEDGFAALQQFAGKIGAATGASRALVDSGVAPNEYQVGQTGKVVAPDVYIAMAISGAVQHMAGMKDSRMIISVNTDANAPLHALCDYVLVADAQDVLAALNQVF